ncbi:hypothetical protein M8J75_006439 [Diaphorina citri]|nr:hypothetical protein M8J75_006439 [Diaphorina citri]
MVHFYFSIFLLTVLIYVLTHLWTHRRFYYLGFKIPGPPGWPLNGNCPMIFGSLKHVTRIIIKSWDESSDNFIYKLWVGPVLFVFPTDPDTIDKILLNVLHKAPCYNFISGSSGQGLLHHMYLPRWAKHRKIIGTSFQFSPLKSYIRIFHEEAAMLADKMAALANSGEAFESNRLVGLAALAALMRSMFGVDFEIQQNHYSQHPYLEAVESSFQIFLMRVFKPWLTFDPFYTMSGCKARVRKNRAIQKEFIESVIASVKRKILEEKRTFNAEHNERNLAPFVERDTQHSAMDIQNSTMDSKNSTTDPHNSTLDPQNAMDQRNSMSDRELLHEMVSLLNAGFETVMFMTSLTLILLAIHPSVQEEVYNELQDVLGDSPDSAPTYDQLQRLDLLTRVIKETMRLFPAAPVIARSAPYEVQCGDYTIPAGASIAIFIYGLHRHPQLWNNPNQFDPDRFLPSQSSHRNPSGYVPFSLGPRGCIGSKYAMLQMKTTISTILRRYKILPGDKCKSLQDIRFEFGMTMRSLPGNDIRIEPR